MRCNPDTACACRSGSILEAPESRSPPSPERSPAAPSAGGPDSRVRGTRLRPPPARRLDLLPLEKNILLNQKAWDRAALPESPGPPVRAGYPGLAGPPGFRGQAGDQRGRRGPALFPWGFHAPWKVPAGGGERRPFPALESRRVPSVSGGEGFDSFSTPRSDTHRRSGSSPRWRSTPAACRLWRGPHSAAGVSGQSPGQHDPDNRFPGAGGRCPAGFVRRAGVWAAFPRCSIALLLPPVLPPVPPLVPPPVLPPLPPSVLRRRSGPPLPPALRALPRLLTPPGRSIQRSFVLVNLYPMQFAYGKRQTGMVSHL